jgi:hypothetical protein
MPLTPSGTWEAGWDKSVDIFGVNLKVTATTWDEHVEVLDVTHSQSGGVEAWIPGILRGEGTITANINSAAMPYSFNVFPGNGGVLTWRLGSSNPFSIPFGVTKVHYQSAVAGKVEYSFDVKLNSEEGAYTRAT